MSEMHFFMTRYYDVECGNMVSTWSSSSPCDQVAFNFDCKAISWDYYIEHYWPGLRRYAFKQRDDEEDAAYKHFSRITYISTGIEIFLIILIPTLIAILMREIIMLLLS